MIELPKQINYAEAYLTLKCDLGCSYCINDSNGVKRNRDELSGKDWIKGINKIAFEKMPLTLGGGEPTQHKDFFEILDGVRGQTNIDLLTNLQFDPDEFAKRTSPDRFTSKENPAYKSIRVSYHAEKMKPDEIVDKVARLQDHGFNVGLFGLNHPLNIQDNIQMSELARQKSVYFFIKDFLGKFEGQSFGFYKYPKGLDGKLKTAWCRSKELLIDPESEIYKCHRDLYKAEHPKGSLDSFPELYNWAACTKYGECNPCDVKQKTNRFLDKGGCQVDIKEA